MDICFSTSTSGRSDFFNGCIYRMIFVPVGIRIHIRPHTNNAIYSLSSIFNKIKYYGYNIIPLRDSEHEIFSQITFYVDNLLFVQTKQFNLSS